jgi:hypothetical protein
MTKSALQIARASYVPKMPEGLKGNVDIRKVLPHNQYWTRRDSKTLPPIRMGCRLFNLYKQPVNRSIGTGKCGSDPFRRTGSRRAQCDCRNIRRH